MSKWKFINNGEGWWLRIENIEQLSDYVNMTSGKFGNSMMNVMTACSNGKYQHYTNQLDSYLELLYRGSGKSLIEVTQQLMFDLADVYCSLLFEAGFVNINKCGGCNNEPYIGSVVCYRDTLVFPDFTERDIKIKTWKIEDQKAGNIRNDYKYHYYAYIGDIQLKDGNKVKWDTYDEAYEFATKYTGGVE